MVGVMTRNGIVVRRGDCFDIVMGFRDKSQNPINLADCSIVMCVKEPKSGKLLFRVDGEIVSDEEGKAIIRLKPEHTNNQPTDYVTDIELRLKNGSVHTIFPQDISKSAIFRITEDVTEV